MDIVIRTLNRPYCLERLLRSIGRRMTGVGRIVVVDDGTPEVYMDEIRRRHPEVEVVPSPNWATKAALCQSGGIGRQQAFEVARELPVRAWIAAVRTLSDPFLLLEDDMWLIEDLDLDELADTMRRERIAMVRLASYGQRRTFPDPEHLSDHPRMEQSRPRYLAMARRFPAARKVYSLKPPKGFAVRRLWQYSRKLGYVPKDHWYHLWGIFSDSGAAFSKDYWLAIWDESETAVDESRQIDAALRWAAEHTDAKFTRLMDDRLRTSYVSCATGRRWPELGCDMWAFNRIMNEAWLAGEFAEEIDREVDYDPDLIASMLDRAADPECPSDSWRQWHDRMRGVYAAI